MIAADTCTWIAYLQGEQAEDTNLLDQALHARYVLMPPIVLTELLSDPGLPPATADWLTRIPLLDIETGFWQRAGSLRASVLALGRRARLGDALIAQTCIDHRVPLLTRDDDFQPFTKTSPLIVLPDATRR